MLKVIRNKTSHQIIVYTDSDKTPENSYPLAPRATARLDLTDEQVAFIKETHAASDIQLS